MVAVTFIHPHVLTPRPSLYNAIADGGFEANISACWDAGVSTSYPGSGQAWFDLTGVGYDLYLGATGVSGGDDPTFNGQAGNRTAQEYFSFDGGDFFTLRVANPAWAQNLHKNNANFTFLAVVWSQSGGPAERGMFGTNGGTFGNTGVHFNLTPNLGFSYEVSDAGTTELQRTGTDTIAGDVWHFIGLSIDEAANVGFFYADGAYVQRSGSNTWTCAYTSPSIGDASHTLSLGSIGNGILKAPNGTRMACAAFLNDALSKAQIDSIYNRICRRFGLNPA